MPDRFPPHAHFQTTKSRSITLRLIIQIGAEDRNRTGTNLTIRGILSPLRLPVPPPRQVYMNVIDCNMEAAPRIELGIKVLQTSALPLGYAAIWSGKRDSNPRPQPWQGCALPLSYFRICLTAILLYHSFVFCQVLFSSDRTDVSLGISATFDIVSYRLLRVNRKFSFSQDVHFAVSTLAVRRKVLYTILPYFARGFLKKFSERFSGQSSAGSRYLALATGAGCDFSPKGDVK